jgi:hypothetical protein
MTPSQFYSLNERVGNYKQLTIAVKVYDDNWNFRQEPTRQEITMKSKSFLILRY